MAARDLRRPDLRAGTGKLNLTLKNHGTRGAHAPGIYDLSLHGANGFFRRFAGSPLTALHVESHEDHDSGRLRLKIISDHSGSSRHAEPVVVTRAWQLAGRVESAGRLTSDPQLGQS